MSLIAGPYVNPLSTAFNQQTYTPGQAGTFKVVFRNKGVLAASNVHVILTSASPNITIPVTQYNYSSLASFASDSATFNFTVGASAPNNCAITTTLVIKLDTTTIYTAGAYVLVGSGTVILNDQANSFTNWTTNGAWNTTTLQSHSAPSSFTDSPGGNYGNNVDVSMTLATALNTSATPVLFISFWHRYANRSRIRFLQC